MTASELSKTWVFWFFFLNQMYFSEATSISLPWSSCFSIIIIHSCSKVYCYQQGCIDAIKENFAFWGTNLSFANSWTRVLIAAKSNICVAFQSQLRLTRSWEQGRISVMKQSPGEPQPRSHVKHLPLWHSTGALQICYPSCHCDVAAPTPALSGHSRGNVTHTVCREGIFTFLGAALQS